jgi:hypothetical protein
MANVFDSALVVATISEQVQTVLANRLAPLRIMSTDFSNEVRKPKDTVQVPLVTDTSATSTNPTDFTPASSVTVGKATVTLDHYAQFFGITQAELANGHRLENLVRINLNALADKIFSVAITPITTVNFGAATVTTTTITPGSGHLATLWSAISKADRKGLVVTPEIYSKLIPTNADFLPLQNGAYGFDQGIYYANSFSGAVAGLDGFADSAPKRWRWPRPCLPIDPAVANLLYVSDSVTLDQLGMTIMYNITASQSTRTVTASCEVMFGSAAGLTSGTCALII